jgi:hypothetical protein
MSATSSPPAFADPLAEDGVARPPSLTQASQAAEPGERAHQGRLSRDRAALLAPDVERRIGADAIELVRANGLIAAIETVQNAEDSQQGLVIEQDPPAGTPMLREGVLTLRVAQAPAEPEDTDDDDPAAPGHAESSSAGDEDEDDTEQWFTTLGPTLEIPALAPDATLPRRRRKHRPAPIPAAQIVFDTPPDPLSAPCDPPTGDQPNLSPQLAEHGPLTSLIVPLLVRLPSFSVSRAWRRRALILVGAIVGLVLLTRVVASHSHPHEIASLAQGPASRPRVGPPPTSAHLRNRLATVPLSRWRTSRRLPSRPRTPNTPHESIAATATAATPAPITSVPSSSSSAPASGPFIYLGK